jgi:hypothetical protein
MSKDKTDYRKDIKALINAQSKCPNDGFSCCSICPDCGQRYCDSGHSYACERMLGRGCSGTRGKGCPKGWHVDV